MSAMKFLTSLVLVSCLMTSLVEGACYKKPLSFDQAPGLSADQTGLSGELTKLMLQFIH